MSRLASIAPVKLLDSWNSWTLPFLILIWSFKLSWTLFRFHFPSHSVNSFFSSSSRSQTQDFLVLISSGCCCLVTFRTLGWRDGGKSVYICPIEAHLNDISSFLLVVSSCVIVLFLCKKRKFLPGCSVKYFLFSSYIFLWPLHLYSFGVFQEDPEFVLNQPPWHQSDRHVLPVLSLSSPLFKILQVAIFGWLNGKLCHSIPEYH